VVISEKHGVLTEKLHALVPQGSPAKTLQDLKGSVVASSYLEDARFATRVVFAGALDASADVALVTTRSPVEAMKRCAQEKPLADGRKLGAIVVDDAQLEGMREFPEMKQLRVLWSSRPLPTPPFVAFDTQES